MSGFENNNKIKKCWEKWIFIFDYTMKNTIYIYIY